MGGRPDGIGLRWMLPEDYVRVLAIEEDTFEYPWALQDLMGVLRSRESRGVVVEVRGEVVGYMLYYIHPSSVELLSIAVAYRYRRVGCGDAMVAWLKGHLGLGRSRMFVTVRERNLPAQVFFRSHGFRAERIVHDYFRDTDEDAYLMAYRQLERVCSA